MTSKGTQRSVKITIVDPPSGWLYGFPAPLEEDYEEQLRKAGYPEEAMPLAMKHSRYWEIEKENDE